MTFSTRLSHPGSLALFAVALWPALTANVACNAKSPNDESTSVGTPSGTADSGGAAQSGDAGGARWVGTWGNGPQLTEMANLPPAPGLTGNTLRQVGYVSIGGSQLRVRLSNAYGDGPVTMTAVHLAAAKGMATSTIDPTTDKALTFSGSASVTIAPGDTIFSDPFPFALAPLSTVSLTIAFGTAPVNVTGHPGSRTTSFLIAGNMATASDLTGAATMQHWYYWTGIDVMASAASSAVITLGDSLADGRGSDIDGNDRWPDDLSRRLQANAGTKVDAMLNMGIGGNAVLTGGLGPTAEARFANDVLNQSAGRWLIVFEGVNDIGGATSTDVATMLITAFGQFVDMAHSHGMRAFGMPITPFGGSMYDSADHQTERTTVNTWIRTSGKFDAVLDMDPVVGDPSNAANILPAYDSGDHLHLNAMGYQKMADSIDLTLFSL